MNMKGKTKYGDPIDLSTLEITGVPDAESKKMIDDLVKIAQEAKNEAFHRGIEANVMVINSRYRYVKQFFVQLLDGIATVGPMLCGMRVLFDELGEVPRDASFLMLHVDDLPQDRLQRLEEENRELREKIVRIREMIGSCDEV